MKKQASHKKNHETDSVREPISTERTVCASRIKVFEDKAKRLCLKIDDHEFSELTVRRVFPLSKRSEYVSFINRDGKETVMVKELSGLEPESRRILNRSLERVYYAAKILRVDNIKTRMGVGQWDVHTDRGYAVFELADREAIRKLDGGKQLMITDADGNRFEIEDMDKLDNRSRNLVAGEL